MTLLAFHGDSKIKNKYIRRIRGHMKADELVQGYGYWQDGKGCAIGCCLHSSEHAAYPKKLGIPEELAYLEDHFFERLPKKTAREWPLRFLKAAKTGADLSRVYDLWSAWNLDDPEYGVLRMVKEEFADVRAVVKETADACRNGDRVNSARAAWAAEAAQAAWAAGAAWAAEAAQAAGAAQAAWAAGAAGAAGAAQAAQAAGVARAAGAAQAAGVARAAYYKAASDKLIELMESAPLVEEQ